MSRAGWFVYIVGALGAAVLLAPLPAVVQAVLGVAGGFCWMLVCLRYFRH